MPSLRTPIYSRLREGRRRATRAPQAICALRCKDMTNGTTWSFLSLFLFSGLRGTFNDKHNEEIGELDILFSNLAPPGALEAPAVSSP